MSKIVIDSAIPMIRGVLEPYAEVIYRPGQAFTPADVRNADALVIRTRTRCDETLLRGSRVRLIATATIGYDHIDLDYCRCAGIRVATAAGCNARGVLQWMAAALALLSDHEGWRPEERTIGIVGVGHIGSLVEAYARQWGFHVLCCDPPRAERERNAEGKGNKGGKEGAGCDFLPSEGIATSCDFRPLEEVAANCDILTFHTPLDGTTRHLCDRALLATMRRDAVIINCSRGPVVDNRALLESGRRYLLDVWEDEPHPDPELLAQALVATPHIAGYSLQGKANATAMSVRAVAETLSLPLAGWYPAEVPPVHPRPIGWEELRRTIVAHCDLAAETRTLQAAPDTFEALRDHYRFRPEYF